MTVQELIDELKLYDTQAEVVLEVDSENGSGYYDISEVAEGNNQIVVYIIAEGE